MHDKLINDRLSFYFYCDNHAEILFNESFTTFGKYDNLMFVVHMTKQKLLY